MSIYTKQGDRGQTSLRDGRIVSKASAIPHAVGTVDELNAHIGLVISLITANQPYTDLGVIQDILREVQEDLFVIGSYLAGNDTDLKELKKRIAKFEKTIDEVESDLPKLKNFILPGGSKIGAQLHITRTICRRTERMVVDVEENEDILQYLNRLSDFLFMCARKDNLGEEVLWKN